MKISKIKKILFIVVAIAIIMIIAGWSFDKYLAPYLLACGPNTTGEAIAFILGSCIVLLLNHVIE